MAHRRAYACRRRADVLYLDRFRNHGHLASERNRLYQRTSHRVGRAPAFRRQMLYRGLARHNEPFCGGLVGANSPSNSPSQISGTQGTGTLGPAVAEDGRPKPAVSLKRKNYSVAGRGRGPHPSRQDGSCSAMPSSCAEYPSVRSCPEPIPFPGMLSPARSSRRRSVRCAVSVAPNAYATCWRGWSPSSFLSAVRASAPKFIRHT